MRTITALDRVNRIYGQRQLLKRPEWRRSHAAYDNPRHFGKWPWWREAMRLGYSFGHGSFRRYYDTIV